MPRGKPMKKRSIILFLLFILLSGIVLAIPFTPQGDIDLKSVYGIRGATSVNGSTVDMTGNISTDSWFIGFYNWVVSSAYATFNGTVLSINESGFNESFIPWTLEGTLNVNHSQNATEWDGETSQENLNVNYSKSSNESDYWDSRNTPADITIAELTATGEGNLNVNSSTYWDRESSQANLNVNQSDFWDGRDGPSDLSISVLNQSGEGDLNVNSSNFWDRLTSYNSTVFQQETGGLLGIVKGWYDGLYCQLTGCIMTGNITSSAAGTFTTINTGQGANELYDMNQNVQSSDSPTFANSYLGEYLYHLSDTTTSFHFTPSTIDAIAGNLIFWQALGTGTYTYTINTNQVDINYRLSTDDVTSAFGFDAGDNYGYFNVPLGINNRTDAEYVNATQLAINGSTLSSLFVDVTGDSMTGSIDMGTNDIFNADDINATEFYQNGNLVIDLGDVEDLNVNYSDTSGLAEDSTAWITMTSLQSKWLADVGNVLTYDEAELNTSIANALATTYYNHSSVNLVTGTAQGATTNINKHDEVPYNVSESASDILFYVNFTGITTFNQVLIFYRTITGEVDDVQLSILRCSDSVWEGYKLLSNTDLNYEEISFTVSDPADHVCSGVVTLRFQTTNVGARTDKWNFDWVALSKGVASQVGIELDPLSIHKSGDVPLTANWDAGAFNITTQAISTGQGYQEVYGINTSPFRVETNNIGVNMGLWDTRFASIAITQAYDSNASTACSGSTTYLNGENGCVNVAPVYVDVLGDTMTGLLTIDQNTNARSLYIDSEATTQNGLTIEGKYPVKLEVDITGGRALLIERNLAEAGSLELVKVLDDNSANTQNSVLVQNDGTGKGIFIDQNGNGIALDIDSEATTKIGINVAMVNALYTALYTNGIINASGFYDNGVLLTGNYDSNASTACAGSTTYLNGENGCVDISSVYAPITITQAYDSNASTICAGATTYLNGENGCVDIGAVYYKSGDAPSFANITSTDDIKVAEDNRFCLNVACTSYMLNNGTGVVIV